MGCFSDMVGWLGKRVKLRRIGEGGKGWGNVMKMRVGVLITGQLLIRRKTTNALIT